MTGKGIPEVKNRFGKGRKKGRGKTTVIIKPGREGEGTGSKASKGCQSDKTELRLFFSRADLAFRSAMWKRLKMLS